MNIEQMRNALALKLIISIRRAINDEQWNSIEEEIQQTLQSYKTLQLFTLFDSKDFVFCIKNTIISQLYDDEVEEFFETTIGDSAFDYMWENDISGEMFHQYEDFIKDNADMTKIAIHNEDELGEAAQSKYLFEEFKTFWEGADDDERD